MTEGQLFNNISIVGHGGTSPGKMRIYQGGIVWRKQGGGGKAVEIDKDEMVELLWMKVSRTHQLSVRSKDGFYFKFVGFLDQDVATLTTYFQITFGITPVEKQRSVIGRNWGEIEQKGILFWQIHVKPNWMKVFYYRIMPWIDDDKGNHPVVTFDGIAILTPRGQCNLELHLSFLRLQGQANEFKIPNNSVVWQFLLPKFETDYVFERKLCIDEALLNARYKDKLEPSYKGPIHEVFTTILRGLSGAKVTKPGMFRSAHDNYAVKSSLKLEDGVLYPLERSFFFLPKPPTLILHEEIEFVEFPRHTTGASCTQYFDLLIKLDTTQQHLFCNIQKNEYQNLFDYISRKGLKIRNLGEANTTDVAAVVLHDEVNDAVDPHLERIKNESGGDETNEEDEDFDGDKDDGGSPNDDPGEGDTVI